MKADIRKSLKVEEVVKQEPHDQDSTELCDEEMDLIGASASIPAQNCCLGIRG